MLWGTIFFLMRLKSDKSYLLQTNILSAEIISTRLKVKMLWGKYMFWFLFVCLQLTGWKSCWRMDVWASRWRRGILWAESGRGGWGSYPRSAGSAQGRCYYGGHSCERIHLRVWKHKCVHAHWLLHGTQCHVPLCLRLIFFLNGKQQFPLFLDIVDDHMLIV